MSAAITSSGTIRAAVACSIRADTRTPAQVSAMARYYADTGKPKTNANELKFVRGARCVSDPMAAWVAV
jgi:hypothetical protein